MISGGPQLFKPPARRRRWPWIALLALLMLAILAVAFGLRALPPVVAISIDLLLLFVLGVILLARPTGTKVL